MGPLSSSLVAYEEGPLSASPEIDLVGGSCPS